MNPIKILFILFSLFTFHFSLFAQDALPVLVEGGEPFENREDFYILNQSGINTLAIDHNVTTIISGSNDGVIKIWDIDSGKELKRLRGHTDRVWSVVISKDDKNIISGSRDKSIKIWNKFTGELEQSLMTNRYNVPLCQDHLIKLEDEACHELMIKPMRHLWSGRGCLMVERIVSIGLLSI